MKCECYSKNGCRYNPDGIGICKKYKSKIDNLSLHCCGSWSKEKIDHFKHYAEMFSTGMKNVWGGNLYYLDLFSGPGKCIDRGNMNEFDSTCVQVINLKDKFKKYFLIDNNAQCINDLKQRLKNEKNVEYYNKDCNVSVQEIIEKIPKTSLGLAIIDPDSLQFHLDSFKELSKRKIDLIVNYPIGPINRATSSVLKNKSDSKTLDKFHPGWKSIMDKKSWGSAITDLINDYMKKVEGLGYFTSKSLVFFKNDKNVPLYYLVFFCKDKKGIEFWEKTTKSFEKRNPQPSIPGLMI
jgi:three-Cys-motif partner protein